MNNNPLMQFARRPELSVSLATTPSWYPEGFINYTLNGEVEVYPMLPKDELSLYNPDALLSGQAMIGLIHSCCPSILDPAKLYYPDGNILLLAIKRATYGNEHKQSHMCPKCNAKLEELKNDPKKKDELDKLIAEHKISEHEEEFTFNIDSLLMSITHLEDDYKVKIENLIYHLQPYIMKTKEQYAVVNGQRTKLLKMYRETLEREEDISEEEKNKMISEISAIQNKMIDANNEIYVESIKFIELPDGSTVNDKEMIKEFIANAKSSTISEFAKEINKINAVGLPEKLEVECSCCGHKWEVPFTGFNQSDFFE